MLQFEQKSGTLMKDTVWKFPEATTLVLDAFAGTLSKPKACMLLESHRRLVGFKKYGGCWENSMSGLLEVYACQLQKDKSDLKECGRKLCRCA